MNLSSLRRYDVQARVGLWTSLAAVLPFLAAALQSYLRYDHQLRAIQYGQQGKFKIAFLLCVGLAMMLSVLGLGLGYNSAGQRRNKEQRRSWLGFFIGTTVLSFSVILFFAFLKLKFEIVAV